MVTFPVEKTIQPLNSALIDWSTSCLLPARRAYIIVTAAGQNLHLVFRKISTDRRLNKQCKGCILIGGLIKNVGLPKDGLHDYYMCVNPLMGLLVQKMQ